MITTKMYVYHYLYGMAYVVKVDKHVHPIVLEGYGRVARSEVLLLPNDCLLPVGLNIW